MKKFFIGRTGPAPGSDRRAMNEAAGSRPVARASSPAAEFDHAAWWLDAATGGEYLDDRIRVREPEDRE
jgi:hypothetical protein